MNIIAAPACTAWIEVMPYGYFMPSFYGSLAEQCGLLYYYYYDRDARAGKPDCMVKNKTLDPEFSDAPLVPWRVGRSKEYKDARFWRREIKIEVDLGILEKKLHHMQKDHAECLKNGGRENMLTNFTKLLGAVQDSVSRG